MQKPPTVKELLSVLDRVTIRVVGRARKDGVTSRGYCEDSTIVVGRALHAGKFEEMVLTGIHELCHVRDNFRGDHRINHARITRWELRLYKSHTLCEAVAVRLGNAWLFGDEDP